MFILCYECDDSHKCYNSKQRVLSFNLIGLFDFEQLFWRNLRSRIGKKILGATHGPQLIRLDISFHGAKFVYDIPIIRRCTSGFNDISHPISHWQQACSCSQAADVAIIVS